MKTKKVIQRNLPLTVKYILENISYLSIEDGGGCSCDNCGKLITNIAHVKDSNNKSYAIGLDCLDTLLINNNLLEQDSYVNYLFSDKPALQKAKSLRSKLLKKQKEDVNYKATFKKFEDSFGFRFETLNVFRGWNEPMGYDYTFNIKYLDLTLNYIKGLTNVIL